MIKIILILFISWLIIRSIRFMNNIKIVSSKNKKEELRRTKKNADIQEGEFEEVE